MFFSSPNTVLIFPLDSSKTEASSVNLSEEAFLYAVFISETRKHWGVWTLYKSDLFRFKDLPFLISRIEFFIWTTGTTPKPFSTEEINSAISFFDINGRTPSWIAIIALLSVIFFNPFFGN